MLADELLAKLVGRGSEHAFAVLCERHSDALHRYCLSILRNEHDAQDALQSTMTRAYTALRACERDVSLRPWLFRIAHNESVTILRKRSRQSAAGQPGNSQAGDPHARLEQRIRLNQLVVDLHALPERQRATLVMRELSGLGMREIAQALDISAAVAKQSLFEARNSMRDFDRGRAMQCDEVRLAISAQDRRTLRGRRISAHLQACESCRGYRGAIATREADLRALLPALPVPMLAAAFARIFGAGRWAARASGGGAPTNGFSQDTLAHVGASALIKVAAGVAVIAAGATGAARIAHTAAGGPARHSPVALAAQPRAAEPAHRTSRPLGAIAHPLAGSRAQKRPTHVSQRTTSPTVQRSAKAVAPRRRADKAQTPAAKDQAPVVSEGVATTAAGQESGGDSQAAIPASGPANTEVEQSREDVQSEHRHIPLAAEHGDGQDEGEQPSSEYGPSGPPGESGDNAEPAGREHAHEQGGGPRSQSSDE